MSGCHSKAQNSVGNDGMALIRSGSWQAASTNKKDEFGAGGQGFLHGDHSVFLSSLADFPVSGVHHLGCK